MVRCIMLAPTEQIEVSLRRFSFVETPKCPTGLHDASVVIDRRAKGMDNASGDNHPHDDSRWPKACKCGYEFTEADAWQHCKISLWSRSDNQELVTLRDAPVGAIWYADWMSDSSSYRGHDGRVVVVRLPGGYDWMVDSRAKNCTSPCLHCGVQYKDHQSNCGNQNPYDPQQQHYEDSHPEHKCWVRHGTPPDLHVDKNGVTCEAGAGSIAVPGYHGFLHHGKLTDC